MITTATKKITLATIKSFIKKNKATLFIKTTSSFDGMSDMVEYDRKAGFKIAEDTDSNLENTLGVNGAWFVGQSRDRFEAFTNNDFTGFEIWNCCGSFTIAILK